MSNDIDVMVVGAGVIGLAIGRSMQMSGRETVLIDAEAKFGMHTSSRNSEVIHAGIYYEPQSLKARFCVRGKHLLYDYCVGRAIPHGRLGKLIVSTEPGEDANLERYRLTALANGVDDVRFVSRQELQNREPEVRAEAALFSPSTGIIDSHAFMLSLLSDFETAGGIFARKSRLDRAHIDETGCTVVLDDGETFRTTLLINAAGIDAPALAARMEGLLPEHVPDRRFAIGHYYTLTRRSPFRHLVYPVAVPGALGIHVTLDMAGAARFGPDIRWIDDIDYSFDDSRRDDFAAAIRRYYPPITADDLAPAYTGIRPKIEIDGEVAADFRIDGPDRHGAPGLINLFGIESPGLTSSLAIAEEILAISKHR